jgi:predicted RNase H-like nuclease (RuvC/YqgF family)
MATQRMIMAQEQRLDTERIARMEAQMENLKSDVADVKQDIKELHSRVTTVTREITDHVDDKFDSLIARSNAHEIKDVKIEQKLDAMIQCIESIKVGVAEVHECLDRTGTSLDGKLEKVKERIGILEKWRYMIVGGAIALGYLVGNLDFFAKLLK